MCGVCTCAVCFYAQYVSYVCLFTLCSERMKRLDCASDLRVCLLAHVGQPNTRGPPHIDHMFLVLSAAFVRVLYCELNGDPSDLGTRLLPRGL